MALFDIIDALYTDVNNAYNAVSTKGGVIPANKNTVSLEDSILSITTGGGSSGTATSSEVMQGYTFSNDTGVDIPGSLVNSIGATPYVNYMSSGTSTFNFNLESSQRMAVDNTTQFCFNKVAFGNADPANVSSGVFFTSDTGFMQEGTASGTYQYFTGIVEGSGDITIPVDNYQNLRILRYQAYHNENRYFDFTYTGATTTMEGCIRWNYGDGNHVAQYNIQTAYDRPTGQHNFGWFFNQTDYTNVVLRPPTAADFYPCDYSLFYCYKKPGDAFTLTP